MASNTARFSKVLIKNKSYNAVAVSLSKTLTGAALTTVFWTFSWTRIPFISDHSFFPLWASYILLINGMSEVLFRKSLMKDLGFKFVLLFVYSIPFWWFFEYMNTIVQNWHYIFPMPISPLRFFIESSINFSTVLPSVLSSAYFFTMIFRKSGLSFRGPKLYLNTAILNSIALTGITGIIVIAQYPRIAFPLVWIAPLLIIEPISYALSFHCILKQVSKGYYGVIVVTGLASLCTGIFWEFWNYYSLPKWIYTIPYVDFGRIFEMPLLGYFGYPFFGLIVFSYGLFVFSLGSNSIVVRRLSAWRYMK